jgi:enoyl-CoA hydratase/carnithine racemase
LLRRSSREEVEQAIKAESGEFTARLRSAEAKEAFTAFLEKRRPDFSKAKEATTAR